MLSLKNEETYPPYYVCHWFLNRVVYHCWMKYKYTGLVGILNFLL